MVLKEFNVRILSAETGQYSVVINEKDAGALGLHAGDRVEISVDEDSLIAVAETTQTLMDEGDIGTFTEVSEELNLKEGRRVSVTPVSIPESLGYIRGMIRGETLTGDEIYAIVEDVVERRLTSAEMTAFLMTQELRGMSMEETAALARSMVETGETIEIGKEPVMDVHSIGGVPGNKYSLITVPIVAAAGLTIPKTSSRAITSPAGTADVMEVLAEVSFTMEEISDIVNEVGGILAWGGAVNLAPADDILIQLERQLDIDPKSQLLASVLSKKLAVSSDRILIDIPKGPGAKVEEDDEAEDLAHDFMSLGHTLGVQVETAFTYGGQPLGYYVGPGLEAREALETLRGEGPTSLVEKSVSLAGILLEMSGYASYGAGKSAALDILDSGRAHEKMMDIIEAQGGDPDVDLDALPLGDKREIIPAPSDGYVKRIYNSRIKDIARAAGAPQDKGAGLKLLHKEGREVNKGEPLIEVYSSHEKKLDEAVTLARESPPIRVEGMLLRRISGKPRKE